MIAAAAVVVAALALLVAFAVLIVGGRGEKAAWERLAAREAALDEREVAMREERRELLDRIQAPHMTAARLLPSGDEAEGEFKTDDDVDKAFQERPEAAVKWDPDLTPLPWDLSPSDDVPQPTVEPVRP